MIYEYECQDKECHHTWEEMASINDPVQQECPKCRQLTAKRLISCTNFILAGGGVGWGSSGYSGK